MFFFLFLFLCSMSYVTDWCDMTNDNADNRTTTSHLIDRTQRTNTITITTTLLDGLWIKICWWLGSLKTATLRDVILLAEWTSTSLALPLVGTVVHQLQAALVTFASQPSCARTVLFDCPALPANISMSCVLILADLASHSATQVAHSTGL